MAIKLKNSLFIHVPKTAGRSLSTTLLKNVQGSSILGDKVYDAHSRITLNFTPTFGFIRNPYFFLKSLWNHRNSKRHNNNNKFDWQDYLRLERTCKSENMYDFILNATKQQNIVWDYYMFYLGGHRNLHICKYENITNDTIRTLELFNEKFKKEQIIKDLEKDKKEKEIIEDMSIYKKIIKSEIILGKYYENFTENS